MALVANNVPANARDVRDMGSISVLGRATEGGHDNPLQYSCLENLHGQRSLVGYSCVGSQRVRHDSSSAQYSTALCSKVAVIILKCSAVDQNGNKVQ